MNIITNAKELAGKTAKSLKVKTKVKSGAATFNHNETLASVQSKSKSLKVKTKVKSGGVPNHNETLVTVQPKSKSLKVKTNVKAGPIRVGDPGGPGVQAG